MDLRGKNVLVVGLGRSGAAVAQLCANRGATVTVTDKQPAERLAAVVAGLPAAVVRELGGHRPDSFLKADLVVLSPGVPDLPEIVAARAAGVPVTGELELAARFVTAAIIAITGTNGKSTTTSLTGDMVKTTGRPTFVGGNLGEPLAEAVDTAAAGPEGVCVVECSSFQLETVERFHPRVSVFLNLTDDHLDRHADLEAYGQAKARVFAAQDSGDFLVANVDDAAVARLAATARARVVPISTRRSLDEGGWFEGDALCVRLPGGVTERYRSSLPGRHNRENVLASLCAARLVGATSEGAQRALDAFRPLAHRMALVAEVDGVAFFDDSKGTNVGAVVAAIDGFGRPVVLIAGGRDKGGDYAPLVEALGRVGRAVVLIGEAAERIENAARGTLPVERAASLEQAVVAAARLAQPGDAVVLSPACSSFDMFRDYRHRADVFCAAVHGFVAARAGGKAAR